MRYSEFELKYLPRTVDQLSQGELIQWRDVHYPNHCVLHYQTDNAMALGISPNFSMISHREMPIRIYHWEEHVGNAGNPRKAAFQATSEITRYFRQTPRHMHRARQLERSVAIRESFTVVDYSLLPKMVQYPPSRRVTIDQHLNYISAITTGIKHVLELEAAEWVPQFIPMLMPEGLPEKSEFRQADFPVNPSRIRNWDSFRKMNLLWLWKAIEDEDAELWDLPHTVVFAFGLGKKGFMVDLGQLWTWREKGVETLQNALYRAWEKLLETRTVAPTEELKEAADATPEVSTEEEVVGETRIREQIQPLVDAGRMSRSEVTRIEKLSRGYKALPNPIGEGTLADALTIPPEKLRLTDETKKLRDNEAVLDKSMLDSAVNAFHRDYVNNVMEADILNTVMSVQNAGGLIKGVKVEDGKDALNDYRTYKVDIIPINGQPSTLSIKLPKVSPDGEFTAAGVKYRMDTQKGDLPIRKVSPSKVALTSYMGKLFIERSPRAVNNYGRWIVSKISKAATDADNPSVDKVTYTTQPLPKEKLPRSYTAVAKDIAAVSAGPYRFDFNYLNREKTYESSLLAALDHQELTICGKVVGKPLFLAMDTDGIIYTVSESGTVVDTLDTLPMVIDSEWGEGPVEYAEMGVFGKAVPLAIILCYFRGLSRCLKDLGVHHRWVGAGKALNIQPHETRVRFQDESLILDLRHRHGAMIMAGLAAAKRTTPQFTASDFDNKGVYGLVLSEMGMGRHILKEIDLSRDMFIDPITLELLKEMKEPTDFEELLIRSAELLVTDEYTDEIDTAEMRVKGYERFSGFIYNRLVSAVREQRQAPSGRGKISMPPDAVWGDIIADPAVQLVEESNPIHNLKELEALTYVGQGGRSPKTMVQRTRLYHQNDMGLVSESTPDSAKVAIRTYMTPGAKLKNLRGIPGRFDFDKDGPGNAISTTSLMNPGSTHMDPKRLNMSSVQQSSMVSAKGGTLTPVRTGYEMVIYQRCSDRYAVDAKQDGKVIEVADTHIRVKYVDGSEVGYPLGVEHGVAAGAVIPHRIITDLSAGDSFKQADALCWNEAYFMRDILNPGGVSMRGGTMAYTAFMETTDTLEDSSAISSKLSGRLATPISKKKTVLLKFDEAIANVQPPGVNVEMDTVLCTIESEATAELTDDKAALADLAALANQTPKAKFKGKLSRLEVIYMGDVDDMHPSLQKLARWDMAQRKQRAKNLGQDLPTTGAITEPAFVNGEKVVDNTIAVTFYMDADIDCGVGDKVVFDNALKSIPGRVMEGVNQTADGTELDALFAYQSVANRIVPNCEIIGTTNTVLVNFTRRIVEMDSARTAKGTILKEIQKVVSDLENGKRNAELYEKAFKRMTSVEYGKWMQRLRDGTEFISMIVPSATDMVLSTERTMKVGEKMGVEFFQHLVLTDPMTGETNKTPIKYLAIHLACRRQNQHLVKKQSLPENDRVVDQLSGQVTSVSKGGRISLPELLTLESRGIEKGLIEMIKVRGGDQTAFRDMHEQLRTTGEYTQAALANQNDKPVAVKTLRALLLSVHLDNTIGQQ